MTYCSLQAIYGVEDRDDNLPLQCDNEQNTEIGVPVPYSGDEAKKQHPDGAREVQKTKEESLPKEGDKATGSETQNEVDKSDDAALADTKW